MLTKKEVVAKALALGFADVGFTTADVFESQQEVLADRAEFYAWTKVSGLDLEGGTDPKSILPGAKSIIVLLDAYFREALPVAMEAHFGRCYQDDDRITRDGGSRRVKDFVTFLSENGIELKFGNNIPHRLAAGRAGLGTFGRNNFLYANNAARGSSWVSPIPIVVDQEFEPDVPTDEVGCPDFCTNACIAACPTSALRGVRKLDPRRCIAYMSYYGEGITPMEMREAMGLWVYGCDHCQNVCPRNRPWLMQELPVNKRVAAKAKDFDIAVLLHMDAEHYGEKVWPHMFYMPREDLWRWKMNAARAIGNMQDEKYVPDLVRTLNEEEDERVRGMAAWALGHIGGPEGRAALTNTLAGAVGMVAEEISLALRQWSSAATSHS